MAHLILQLAEYLSLQCPENMQHSVRRNTDATEDFNGPNDNPSEKGLIRLHKKVITATQRARRTQVQWNTLMEKSFDLEDVVVNEKSPDRRFKRVSGKYDGIFKKIHSPTLGKFCQWLSFIVFGVCRSFSSFFQSCVLGCSYYITL